MANNETCDVCGGGDFYIDAGYFFCQECQTQSQQIQEHVHEIPENFVQAKKTKKITSGKQNKEKKNRIELTSWESFNYVLVGLVKDLIELGAKPSLKFKTFEIWMRYLKHIEVFSKKWEDLPKLSLSSKRRDYEVIYKRKFIAPKRKNSGGATSSVSVGINSEKRKRKKLLAEAEYEQISSQKIGEPSTSSVHNVTLQSLKTSTDVSGKNKTLPIRFNYNANKTLQKLMTKRHLKRHCKDVQHSSKHLIINSTTLGSSYRTSMNFLSRQKLYAVLHLALLANQDNIHLGDLLRFNREGHLCFARFKKYFPEDMDEVAINYKSTLAMGSKQMCSLGTRRITSQLAHTLHIKVPLPNLENLCRRYCSELNLPDQLCESIIKIMLHSEPKMRHHKDLKIVPNYEARVMGFIVYTIKMLFGLDNKTEDEFSNVSKRINEKLAENLANKIDEDMFEEEMSEMFNYKQWENFIAYRKRIMEEYHFPTFFLKNGVKTMNPELYFEFYGSYNGDGSIQEEEDADKTNPVLKRFLEKLKDIKPPTPFISQSFKPSLTPFDSYLQALQDNETFKKKDHNFEVLATTFRNSSIDFLLKPKEYLKMLAGNGSKIIVRHGGANDKVVFMKNMENCKSREQQYAKARLEFKKSAEENYVCYEQWVKRLFGEAKVRHKCTLCNSSAKNGNSMFCEHVVTFKYEEEDEKDVNQFRSCPQLGETLVHYLPYQNYWVRFYNSSKISLKNFSEFEKQLPESFKLLLAECARIIEQPTLFVYEELNVIEAYRGFDICSSHNRPNNEKEQRFLDKAKLKW